MIKILAPLLATTLCLTNLHANILTEHTLQDSALVPNISEKTTSHNHQNNIHTHALKNLSALELVLQQISHKITAGLFSPENRAHSKEWLAQFAKTLQLLRALSTEEMDNGNENQALEILISGIDTAITCLTIAIESNCTRLGEPTTILFSSRAHSDTTPDEITSLLTLHETTIQELNKKSRDLGKTWYNKAYSSFMNTASYYDLGKKARIAGVMSAVAAATLYITTCVLMKDIEKKSQEPGIRGKIAAGTHWLNKAIKSYHSNSVNNYNTFASIGALWALWKAIQEANNQFGITQNISSALSSAHTFLIGGEDQELVAAKSEAIVFEGMTLDDKLFEGFTHIQPLKEIVEDIQDFEKNSSLGLKMDKAILLIGSSGSGKTFSIKAFCGSLNKLKMEQGKTERVSYIETTPEALLQKESLKEVIDRAKASAPCVIFCDEVHQTLLQNGTNPIGLNTFLTEFDKLNNTNDPHHFVCFIGATNRPIHLILHYLIVAASWSVLNQTLNNAKTC